LFSSAVAVMKTNAAPTLWHQFTQLHVVHKAGFSLFLAKGQMFIRFLIDVLKNLIRGNGCSCRYRTND
jgi:hypothetical protein